MLEIVERLLQVRDVRRPALLPRAGVADERLPLTMRKLDAVEDCLNDRDEPPLGTIADQPAAEMPAGRTVTRAAVISVELDDDPVLSLDAGDRDVIRWLGQLGRPIVLMMALGADDCPGLLEDLVSDPLLAFGSGQLIVAGAWVVVRGAILVTIRLEEVRSRSQRGARATAGAG